MEINAAVSIENSIASISGKLCHGSVPELLKQLNDGGFSTVDLQQVEHSNSSGVAMLLELIELGKQQGETVRVINMPSQMHRVAELSGVADLL